LTAHVMKVYLRPLVELSCKAIEPSVRESSAEQVKSLCLLDENAALPMALPNVASFLKDSENDFYRLRGCQLLQAVFDVASMSICPYVRSLLPLAMSLMTDPVELCAKTAASIFSRLVQVAPLVRESSSLSLSRSETDKKADMVMDHLIHGKPLPQCDIHPTIASALKASGVTLRAYQLEGVSWLRFLQTMNLSGALCDSMGLGKTLQALVGVALSHLDDDAKDIPRSLVVCPSSVCGHWIQEIERFFPNKKIFRAIALTGPISQRVSLWKEHIRNCNIVVTSYSILRSDIDKLSEIQWRYCILDEGHLLKNPKTGKDLSGEKFILFCRS
jgi:TATA-binding protein-associated factor